MRILLIRHASTYQTEKNFISGDNDDSNLSSKGIEEAESLAKELEDNFKPDRIVVSDSIRARETAKIIFSKKIKDFEYTPYFMEFDKGFEFFLENHSDESEMTTLAWERKYNNLKDIISRLHFVYPSGLTISGYIKPVVKEFIRLVNKNLNKDIAIVAHNGSIKAILTYVLGEHLDIYSRLILSCGAYSELEYENGAFSVNTINKKYLS